MANGFAIGGLSGGEAKEDFIKIVSYCTKHLPNNKPRYLMGVGYPEDLIVCACLGVDMFDCVYPTRTARFGVAFSKKGLIKLKNRYSILVVFINYILERIDLISDLLMMIVNVNVVRIILGHI